jgi:transcriptional regulator with XRE-family HTH domain
MKALNFSLERCEKEWHGLLSSDGERHADKKLPSPPPLPTATFAQRVRKMMSARRLSQSELARLVGYTPTGVWNWLQGNTLPRAETLAALAEILDVTEDWLRDGDDLEVHEDADPEQSTSSETLADKIDNFRFEIAALAGCDVDRVKLTLEFGSS